MEGAPEVDPTFGIDPVVPTKLAAHFAVAQRATRNSKKWMEKFGEWKHTMEVTAWEEGGTATWEVDVVQPGNYRVDLTYAGEGRLVWGVSVEGGQSIRNQQNSSHNYQEFPIGWIEIPRAGRYKVSVSCLDGNINTASLKAIRFVPIPSGQGSPDAAASK